MQDAHQIPKLAPCDFEVPVTGQDAVLHSTARGYAM